MRRLCDNSEGTSVLEIITYPHPTLRYRSKPIQRVDNELRQIVAKMFELMYEAKGIGLAANQVDLPLRLFVCNLTAEPNPAEEHVFINPVIDRPRGSEEGEEGCLSLPGLYAPVVRPATVRVKAYDLGGTLFDADVDGLFGRVIQHETDHLDGVLFIDRLTEMRRHDVAGALSEFELEFRSRREQGGIGSDEQILAGLAEWEARYC